MRKQLLGLATLAAAALLAPIATSAPAPAPRSGPLTPAAVLAASPASAWADIDPDDLLVIDFARGRVVIELAPQFAPAHVANIRKLAQAHWYDGLVIERVQDDYVTQWGDPDGKKPLPPGLVRPAPAEYSRPADGVLLTPLPYPDPYADRVGLAGAFPVGESGGEAWLAHCYGMVGVGRDLNPDTGTGAELYAVIGQPPRGLDRNIAVVGRVLSGMEVLAALPRGTGELGFYANPAQRVPILKARLASELSPGDQPHLQVLKPGSDSFRAWAQIKANRQDSFFLRPAGALDLCNAMPPVRNEIRGS
ncbi:MAG TPA: peptidylprolyl isomerase [Caulobacteraceae bacterium]|jgi:peptidylprolyl isomerase